MPWRERRSGAPLLFGLQNEEVLTQALALWRERHALSSSQTPTTADLFSMGERLWLEYLEAKAAQRERARISEDEEEDSTNEFEEEEEEAEDDTHDDEIVWTPEGVCIALDKIVRRVTRQARRGALLSRLTESTLWWRLPHHPEGPRRLVRFEGGELVEARWMEPEETLAEEGEAMTQTSSCGRSHLADLDTYDRIAVFAGELRRVARDAPELVLRTSSGVSLTREDVCTLLLML